MTRVLVIGASIAGPAVCYWLKKFGFSPVLIEKNNILRKGGYGVDIRGVAVDLVKKMGIYEKITKIRTKLEHGYYVDAQSNVLLEEEGDKFGFRENDEVEIVRGDLVEILMSSIKDIPCYFNQSVVDIKQHPQYVKVTFKDGKTENYDLIIGCDGLHSSTRRMVFSTDEYKLIDLGAYISVFSVPNYLNVYRSEILFESNQKLMTFTNLDQPHTAFAACMFRSKNKLNNIRDENEQKNFLKMNFLHLGWECNKLRELPAAKATGFQY
jgi:2-polyprenyl-6-methoxyphenol hydroxylase-like FAD-dependent oxidoreductase